jgi:hypothetical protein
MFRPATRVDRTISPSRQEVEDGQRTGDSKVVDGASVGWVEVEGSSVGVDGLLRSSPVGERRTKSVPEEEVIRRHAQGSAPAVGRELILGVACKERRQVSALYTRPLTSASDRTDCSTRAPRPSACPDPPVLPPAVAAPRSGSTRSTDHGPPTDSFAACSRGSEGATLRVEGEGATGGDGG